MNLVIDPYMFEIVDEQGVNNAIHFFRILINLCNGRHVRVVLYQNLYEKMLERNYSPFPLPVGKIKNECLRAMALSINDSFTKAVVDNNILLPLDMELCGGNQEYVISDFCGDLEGFKDDPKYVELFHVLLHSCYDPIVQIESYVVTTRVRYGGKFGTAFSLRCDCEKSTFLTEYEFKSIMDFEPESDRAKRELFSLAKVHGFSKIDSPEIVRGKHHNFLQYNSSFTTYEGLSRTNKQVISLLRHFGLKKVVFGEFHYDTTKTQGTITVDEVKQTSDGDVIRGWLYAETDYRNHVDLYFPQDVGVLLNGVFNGVFERNDVERLTDSLCS